MTQVTFTDDLIQLMTLGPFQNADLITHGSSENHLILNQLMNQTNNDVLD